MENEKTIPSIYIYMIKRLSSARLHQWISGITFQRLWSEIYLGTPKLNFGGMLCCSLEAPSWNLGALERPLQISNDNLHLIYIHVENNCLRNGKSQSIPSRLYITGLSLRRNWLRNNLQNNRMLKRKREFSIQFSYVIPIIILQKNKHLKYETI